MRRIIANNSRHTSQFVDALSFERQSDPQLRGGPDNELPDRLLQTGSNDEIFGLFLLQHHPLHADIIASMAPISQSIDVAHI